MNQPPPFDGTQACTAPGPAAAAAFAGQAGVPPEDAKALCVRCPFLGACRDYALVEDVHGVWGGLTAEERHQIRIDAGLPEPRPVGEELDQLVLTWRNRPSQPASSRRKASNRLQSAA